MDNHEFKNIKKKLRLTNQGVSDTMGVRLKTVQCWADGIWEMPLMAEKFLHTLLSMKSNNEDIYVAGHNRGRVTGREAGYIAGHEDGQRTGYSAGLKTGRDEGSNAGYSAGYQSGYGAAMKAVGGLVGQ